MAGTGQKESTRLSPTVTQAELKCLLAILQQSGETGHAATNRIADELQVKPPTVCKLLEHLLEKQLILKEPYGKVELTRKGRQTARSLNHRLKALQASVTERLHLSDSAALQTALFFICHLDEESQRKVLCCEQPDELSQPMIIPHTQTKIRQEAVV